MKKNIELNDIRSYGKVMDMDKYLNSIKNFNPYLEAIKISALYISIGMIWILFSDSIVNEFISSKELITKIQLYKGWFYVVLTGLFICYIIYMRMKIIKNVIDTTYRSYDELNITYEALATTEEKLRTQYEKLQTSVQQKKFMEKEIYTLAYFDSLTGLSNKTKLSLDFKKLILDNYNMNQKFVVLYLDIDDFKYVNNTLGHNVGDKLLIKFSKFLKKKVHPNSIIARISSDEFVIVLVNIEQEDQVTPIVNDLLKSIRSMWAIDNHEIYISASIGGAIYPDNGKELDTLLRNADEAMFYSKQNGKNQYCLYSNVVEENITKYMNMVTDIRYAISKDEFKLYYQPIVDLQTENIIGVEALIRWYKPSIGFISPNEFIPIAERSGLIVDIEKWVLETSFKQKKEWELKGYELKMSVNISPKCLKGDTFISDIERHIERYNINKKEIQLEITETAAMNNIEEVINIINRLRTLDIKIALDDFGTGYSSLTYLRKLPVDVLKMDKAFIDNIKDNNKNNFIVQSVINLAHNLNMQLVAEGIEVKKQVEYLKNSKCDLGQGYYFSRPLPSEDIDKLLIANGL